MNQIDITIVMTLYFPVVENPIGSEHRARVAQDTLRSWFYNLQYSGRIFLHVAYDNRQDMPYFNNVIRHIFTPAAMWRDSMSSSWQDNHGVGASLNAGFRRAFDQSPIVFYAVDDWSLEQPLDLDPWVELLLEREDVGMVRLGPPHPNNTGRIEPFTSNWQSWGLRLDRQGFAFGHRPALYHKRMIDAYGWFAEDTNALECERLYAEKFAHTPAGPDIVLALPHPFQHLDSIELAYVEPKGK